VCIVSFANPILDPTAIPRPNPNYIPNLLPITVSGGREWLVVISVKPVNLINGHSLL